MFVFSIFLGSGCLCDHKQQFRWSRKDWHWSYLPEFQFVNKNTKKSYFLLTGRSWAQYMIPRVYKSEYDVSPACPAWLEQLSTLLELQISSFQNQLFIVNKSDLAQNRPNNIEKLSVKVVVRYLKSLNFIFYWKTCANLEDPLRQRASRFSDCRFYVYKSCSTEGKMATWKILIGHGKISSTSSLS